MYLPRYTFVVIPSNRGVQAVIVFLVAVPQIFLCYLLSSAGHHDVSFWMPEDFANAILSTLKRYGYSTEGR
jgi:hypothetical protein